jgi:hypothetical protein
VEAADPSTGQFEDDETRVRRWDGAVVTGSPQPCQRPCPHTARPRCRPAPAWWLVTGIAVIVVFCLARTVPPWHPDGTWWGAFLTSAGFGGSLAVIGAGAASCVALHNSSRDREQKRSADDLALWWDRFAWACEKTVSDDDHAPAMGLAVLRNLIGAVGPVWEMLK